ncbi:hypothetical protein KGF54_000752 [Candida jiufengensis]|uniref:uncharacterized protein n=1 Tax=Candida jiufengensis TaxID=497108 RepID=UPI002224E1AD|nr:uncharacterized protein KGF54_000752 [Candida jiufengensis]KAI5956277.1 hypothetical protein KGF54_000752 [Candida jiufengensis]
MYGFRGSEDGDIRLLFQKNKKYNITLENGKVVNYFTIKPTSKPLPLSKPSKREAIKHLFNISKHGFRNKSRNPPRSLLFGTSIVNEDKGKEKGEQKQEQNIGEQDQEEDMREDQEEEKELEVNMKLYDYSINEDSWVQMQREREERIMEMSRGSLLYANSIDVEDVILDTPLTPPQVAGTAGLYSNQGKMYTSIYQHSNVWESNAGLDNSSNKLSNSTNQYKSDGNDYEHQPISVQDLNTDAEAVAPSNYFNKYNGVQSLDDYQYNPWLN